MHAETVPCSLHTRTCTPLPPKFKCRNEAFVRLPRWALWFGCNGLPGNGAMLALEVVVSEPGLTEELSKVRLTAPFMPQQQHQAQS